MNLYSLFLKNFNEKKKLIFNNEIINYSDFKKEIENFSKILIIKKINKFAILSDNPKLVSVALFASAKEGKTIITLNKSLLKRQIDIQLKTTKPDIIISDNYSDLKKFKSFNFFVYKNNDNFHSKKKQKTKHIINQF